MDDDHSMNKINDKMLAAATKKFLSRSIEFYLCIVVLTHWKAQIIVRYFFSSCSVEWLIIVATTYKQQAVSRRNLGFVFMGLEPGVIS